MTGFIYKSYWIYVNGFDRHRYFTSSPGKARAKAWGDFGSVSDMSFKDFLRISRVTKAEPPEHFGLAITVSGKEAFFVSSNRQYVQFVWPGSDVILNSHPYDVEPEHMRPSTYRKAA